MDSIQRHAAQQHGSGYLNIHSRRPSLQAVLRIHDILVRIRIRIWIGGSMPRTNGSGCGSRSYCYQKNNFFNNFFCLLHFEGTFGSFLKIKRQKNSPNSRNQGFSYYFCLMIEGSESISMSNGSGSRRLKNMWIRWIWMRIRNIA